MAEFISSLGLANPLTYSAVFLAASLLMIWRLNALMDHGLEGTALGTLVMPYCSGLGNIFFVALLLNGHGEAGEVMTNCVVNNVTNLTLLLALPALLWKLELVPGAPEQESKKKSRARSKKISKLETEQHLGRLSLLLTLAAVAFFTAAVWALGQDGEINRNDGMVLVGLFLFWQCFQVFDVLKHNVRQKHTFSGMFYVDLLVLLFGAVVLYLSLDWLVKWLATQKSGYVSMANLGWLSGWLMVLPNALLAFYYAAKKRPDIVYTSQVGDGHVCIPLCVGLFAIFKPIPMPAFFETSMLILLGAVILHLLAIVATGRLPRWASWILLLTYACFVYSGFVK